MVGHKKRKLQIGNWFPRQTTNNQGTEDEQPKSKKH